MLQGATEDELVSVRQGWMAHVAHLRKVHRVRVEEESPGFWRITGATAPAAEPEARKDPIAANDTIEDEGEEIGVEIQAHAQPSGALDSRRLVVTARALAALASEGLLSNAMLKASVGMLIRQASESHVSVWASHLELSH